MNCTCENSCNNGVAPDIFDEEAALFKALGDERRLRIVHMIAQSPGICSCKILEAFDMSQPTLSHHMKLLCSAGIVDCEKNGKWVRYTLSDKGIDRLSHALESIRS